MWFENFISNLSTPLLLIILIILLGKLIGKIKIFSVSLGNSGVLLVALLSGLLIEYAGESIVYFNTLLDAETSEVYDFASSLGTALFISVIGFNAGKILAKRNIRGKIRAFLAGFTIVFVGFIVCLIISLSDSSLSASMSIGIFSGALTSTPAMLTAQELFSDASEVIAGYGLSYWISLIFTVLFIQIACAKPHIRQIEKAPSPIKEHSRVSTIMHMTIIATGITLGAFINIGTTAGVLIAGIVYGYTSFDVKNECFLSEHIKEVGLCIFFAGCGIPAGSLFIKNLDLSVLIYGFLISAFSVLLGFVITRYVFNFSRIDTLSIICGGMTSTPAIGVLKERSDFANLSLYAISYTGSLFALISSVYILNFV